MPSLFFNLNGASHEVELYPDLAPKTIGKLVASLPAKLDIHCAKIAGQHIFWHAPIVADIEKAQDILTLPPGTFLYWPERQFLELIYGELQAEKAQVCVLGRLKGDIGWLKEFGRHVVENHGQGLILAELTAAPDALPLAAKEKPLSSPGLVALREARKAIWQEAPEEMFTLLKREGMMLPYGPLAMAEGELRKLHELLWRLRGGGHGIDAGNRGEVIAFLIEAFNARIDGFCGLHEIGARLESAKSLLAQPETVDDVVEELILYTGRAAAWLDAYIPWNALNVATLVSLQRQGVR
ncbi:MULTISPECIES: hypothetical protein [Mesorhizobium]|uniref:Uncharacterized protein n=1 Tax=Rhizobium loti TaxID=381 RepID=A0A6M7TZW1_RHILI|nr:MULTISPECIES: hypothetical protein [Mesorhizobium]KRB31177.1 hypothetical protein ASE05_28335 [Mesorhizobium sp. Root172]OBQ60932.1 hypothetical protein A8145_23800 [Mesorhizobium loti]QKC70010.1 hypothetical protein EB815_13250 [Mesorhizobium loti]QKC92108.1 hypothetical protein EB230_29690 [Mesorhizobium sp. NZP2234]